MQRHARNSRRRACQLSKELHKHRLIRHGVLVRQNPDCPGLFQNLEHYSRRFILENRLVPRQTPVTIHQTIDLLVVDGPRHVVQRKAIQGVRKRRQLPRSDVPRQIEHTFPAPLALQKVVVPVEHHNLLDIFLRISGKPRKLRRHPSQIPHHSASHRLSLRITPVWKRDSQIHFRGFPQFRQHRVENPHHASRETPRQWPRQHTQPFENDPRCRVFHPFFHHLAHFA